MLIPTTRPTPADLAHWQRYEAMARLHARNARFRSRVDRARTELLSFVGAGPCYAGVSWGKDSVALAALVADLVPRVPLVWVRVEPDYNPDCPLVRDAFLATHPGLRYEEIVVERQAEGAYRAHGTLERGMARVVEMLGTPRYLSGVRAAESAARKRRHAVFGHASKNTCAPLSLWDGLDVFAFLVSRDLPIHPAYACTMGGLLDPVWLRVSPIGPLDTAVWERQGDEHGRAEWERRYYGADKARIRAALR